MTGIITDLKPMATHNGPGIRAFLDSLSHEYPVKLLAYHNYAGSKYRALDSDHKLPQDIPTQQQLDWAESILHK